MYSLDEVKKQDPAVAEAIELEIGRQNGNIELIASENFVSKAVMAAMGSPLTNKYAEGYPGKRYYGGCQYVDIVENLAIERAKALFDAEYVNVQPHSGAQANYGGLSGSLKAGRYLYGNEPGSRRPSDPRKSGQLFGKVFHCVPYGVNDEGFIDYDQVRRIALENHPEADHCRGKCLLPYNRF